MRLRTRTIGGRWPGAVAALALAAAGCNAGAALEQLSEAYRLSADLLVQFTAAADAANRAVMADTDEASAASAREAEQAKKTVQDDVDALRPVLQRLAYSEEARLLDEFVRRFAQYRTLDRTVLELAVENTNIKAQQLSFGPGQAAADSFRDALGALAPSAENGSWHVKALVATAIGDVREMQALQAQHIAAADDATMTRLEERMTAAEASARKALEALAPLVQPASRPRLAAAAAALDRFMSVNAQIMPLSRRNTNVRSLALSLDQKAKLTSACEESLRALREALARHRYTGRR